MLDVRDFGVEVAPELRVIRRARRRQRDLRLAEGNPQVDHEREPAAPRRRAEAEPGVGRELIELGLPGRYC